MMIPPIKRDTHLTTEPLSSARASAEASDIRAEPLDNGVAAAAHTLNLEQQQQQQ
jgi:hypothetical protein